MFCLFNVLSAAILGIAKKSCRKSALMNDYNFHHKCGFEYTREKDFSWQSKTLLFSEIFT